MIALNYLRRAGLTVEAVADKLRISPAERVTPEIYQYLRDHKAAILVELVAVNDQPPRSWLHLLALADGHVIQRTGDLNTASIEQEARLNYGDELLAVVAVPGFERLLSLGEIAKALAGTLETPVATPIPSSAWLARVARLLCILPAELLEGQHLEQHDLIELAGVDAALVADTIRTSPAWINRAMRPDFPAAVIRVEEESGAQHVTSHTAATASPDWLTMRTHFYQHLMTCPTCHAPAGHYCSIGSGLRQHYNTTPWETNE